MMTLARKRHAPRWLPSSSQRLRRKISLLENLESRVLMSISSITFSVDSSSIGNSGTYFGSGTTGIAGVAPPPGWQPVDGLAQTLHVNNFDTLGGTRVLVAVELSYSADAVTQFTDSLGPNSPFFKPDWSIVNTGAGAIQLKALEPSLNDGTLEANGVILRGDSTLQLSTALNTVLNNAVSGNVQVGISPNPRTINPGQTLTLSANDTAFGTAQTITITNPADLAVFSSTGVDFSLSGQAFSKFSIEGGTFQNNGGVQAARRGSINVTYNYVTPQAKISIDPDAVNAVGDNHTFTVLVEKDDGFDAGETAVGFTPDAVTGFAPASGATAAITLTASNGATPSPLGFNGATDASGNISLTFTSPTAGKVAGHATATVVVSGLTFNLATDGLNGNSDDALKRFVDAKILIGPNGNNPVGQAHTFTTTVLQDDGLNAAEGGDGVTGFTARSGVNVDVTLVGTLGAVPDINGPTNLAPALTSNISGNTNASGQYAVDFTSITAGTVTGNATTTFLIDGVSVTRDTDPITVATAGPGGSGPAIKTFFVPNNGATATIGFWHNKNGKAVMKSSAGLGNWLAATFPNLYGGLAGKNGDQIHAFFTSGTNGYFGSKGAKFSAQVMATALAVYFGSVANTPLAQQFGFGGDLAGYVVNVGNFGAAFNVANNTNITVLDALIAVNSHTVGGVIDPAFRGIYNDFFSAINELLDIP
jgi:hypothetical protein